MDLQLMAFQPPPLYTLMASLVDDDVFGNEGSVRRKRDLALPAFNQLANPKAYC